MSDELKPTSDKDRSRVLALLTEAAERSYEHVPLDVEEVAATIRETGIDPDRIAARVAVLVHHAGVGASAAEKVRAQQREFVPADAAPIAMTCPSLEGGGRSGG